MAETLIIFTRYPEPGKTKTRLIPVLGELGAANLHKKMAEHTVLQAKTLQQTRSLTVEIYFTGSSQNLMQDWLGTMAEPTVLQAKTLQQTRSLTVEIYFTGSSQNLMQDWLGTEVIYHPQTAGNLGQRMANAFQKALQQKPTKTVMIGTDCPQLNSQVLAQAFDALEREDLVLGPATDGGYYLIGLREFFPELFQGINWGTPEVFQQTVLIAQTLNLTLAKLPVFSDIDRPEDLLLLHKQSFKIS